MYKKKKVDLKRVSDNLMKKYSIKSEMNLPEPTKAKLSIITKAKRSLNKQYRDNVSEIENRFEDLSEDIDYYFDELELKISYKFIQINSTL